MKVLANKMSKKELVSILAKALGQTSGEADNTLTIVFDVIKKEMLNGNAVSIPGFGTYEKITRAARNGINPKTKEAIKIPAKGAAKFHIAKGLKTIMA